MYAHILDVVYQMPDGGLPRIEAANTEGAQDSHAGGNRADRNGMKNNLFMLKNMCDGLLESDTYAYVNIRRIAFLFLIKPNITKACLFVSCRSFIFLSFVFSIFFSFWYFVFPSRWGLLSFSAA